MPATGSEGRLGRDGGGEPSVLHLIRVSDPERHYVDRIAALDRCMEKLIEEGKAGPVSRLCHNDAGLSYAATVGSVAPSRVVAIIFGRNAEELAKTIEFPCETIVEKAVHNPWPCARRSTRCSDGLALKNEVQVLLSRVTFKECGNSSGITTRSSTR